MDKVKIILVGESSVGKTSIITQYLYKKFSPDEIKSTTSCDKWEKEIKLENDKIIKCEIWDTAGQEKFRAVNKIFMKNTKIAILVYDTTNKETFVQLKYWYNTTNEINTNFDVIFGIVANKSDLFELRQVTINEGKDFAKNYCNNSLFFETSALDYDSINSVFYDLCECYDKREEEKKKILEKGENKEEILKIKENEEYEENRKNSMSLKSLEKKKKGCCGGRNN